MDDAEATTRFLEAGSGSAGLWTLTACVSAAKPERWCVEIERSQSLFSDFSFSIPGPGVVDQVLAFIQQTIGSRQYSDETHEGGVRRLFVDPQITVGQFAGVPVELYKDGAEDRYFLVVAELGEGALRFVILGEELRDFLLALQQLKQELDAYTAEPGAPES